jgi:hypothetical protein
VSSPTYTCEVAFSTASPLTDPGSWTDITPYLRGFDITRGRAHELTRTGAGTADIRLKNTDRRFDPVYASSPYNPNVKPMKQIRIRATYAAVTYDLFRGFVEDWTQNWAGRPMGTGGGDAECLVHAVDAFKLLSYESLQSYRAVVMADSPIAYFPLTEPAGSTEALDVTGKVLPFQTGGVGEAAMGDANTPITLGAQTSAVLAGATIASGGPIIAASYLTPITYEFWYRPTAFHTAGAIVGCLGDPTQWGENNNDGSFGVVFNGGTLHTAPAFLSIGAWTHIVAVVAPGAVSIYKNGVLDTVAGTAGLGLLYAPLGALTMGDLGGHVIGAAGSLAHLAVYDTALSVGRTAAHYAARSFDVQSAVSVDTLIGMLLDAIGWPAGLRALDPAVSTVSIDPSGSALDLVQHLAEDIEHGVLYVSGAGKITFIARNAYSKAARLSPLATFGDQGSDVPYADLQFTYDDHDLWNQVTASRPGGATQIAEDAASEAAYGMRTLAAGDLEVVDDNAVYDQVNGLLNRYKAPGLRPSMMDLGGVGTAAGATSSLKEQLGREIGDRVAIVRNPPGGGGSITMNAVIEGVKHSDAGGQGRLLTTWSLVPVFPSSPFWILGDATYGVLDSTTVLGW